MVECSLRRRNVRRRVVAAREQAWAAMCQSIERPSTVVAGFVRKSLEAGCLVLCLEEGETRSRQPNPSFEMKSVGEQVGLTRCMIGLEQWNETPPWARERCARALPPPESKRRHGCAQDRCVTASHKHPGSPVFVCVAWTRSKLGDSNKLLIIHLKRGCDKRPCCIFRTISGWTSRTPLVLYTRAAIL